MIAKSKFKYIQSLSHKKFRDEEGVFVAEGPRIINELLSADGIAPVEIFATAGWIAANGSHVRCPVTEVDPSGLERMSTLSTPNRVLGIFRKPSPVAPVFRGVVSLFVESIQDPGNMGTIIRCADWFGIPQVVCSPDCADAFGPKTVQSTMGSIARVSVVVADLPGMLAQNEGIGVYATTLSGTSIHELEPVSEGVILIGNEAKGLSETLLQLAQHRITIPRKGGAESLNAAVAAGIILSHLVR